MNINSTDNTVYNLCKLNLNSIKKKFFTSIDSRECIITHAAQYGAVYRVTANENVATGRRGEM